MERAIYPIADRDEDEPSFEINPVLSAPDMQFSEDDPAKVTKLTGPASERATFDPREEEA